MVDDVVDENGRQLAFTRQIVWDLALVRQRDRVGERYTGDARTEATGVDSEDQSAFAVVGEILVEKCANVGLDARVGVGIHHRDAPRGARCSERRVEPKCALGEGQNSSHAWRL